MKQLKFLMVAFTLMMGISLTSCMGESDPTVTQILPLKVVNTFPYTFQYPNNGLKIVAANSAELMSNASMNLNIGDFAYISYSYNSEEQPITENTKEIDARVAIYNNCSTGAFSFIEENNGAEPSYENATIVELMSVNQGTMYYDKNTLLLGIGFLAEKDVDKHRFSLIYDESNNDGKDGIMNLYLRHVNNEEKPTTAIAQYRAFDLTNFLATFGKTPTKIRVYANETDKSGSCKLEDAKKELRYEELDYKDIFEKK